MGLVILPIHGLKRSSPTLTAAGGEASLLADRLHKIIQALISQNSPDFRPSIIGRNRLITSDQPTNGQINPDMQQNRDEHHNGNDGDQYRVVLH